MEVRVESVEPVRSAAAEPDPWTEPPAWPGDEAVAEEPDAPIGDDEFGLHPEPEKQPWRRKLTIGRACLLTAVVCIVVTWGITWLVTR